MIAPLLLAFLAAGAPQKASPLPPPLKPESLPEPHATAGVPWYDELETARKAARALPGDGRILVEFYEPDCGQCSRMAKILYPAQSFAGLMQDKVGLRVDVTTVAGRALASRLGVQEPPAWFILTPDLLVCGFQSGASGQGPWFETFIRSEASWAEYRKKLARERERPNDLDLAFEIGEETYKRLGDAEAKPRLRRVADAPDARVENRARALGYLASMSLAGERFGDAAKDLDTLLGIARDPALKQRAEVRRAQVAAALGNREDARKRLLAFRAANPGSPLLAEVDEALAGLGPESSPK